MPYKTLNLMSAGVVIVLGLACSGPSEEQAEVEIVNETTADNKEESSAGSPLDVFSETAVVHGQSNLFKAGQQPTEPRPPKSTPSAGDDTSNVGDGIAPHSLDVRGATTITFLEVDGLTGNQAELPDIRPEGRSLDDQFFVESGNGIAGVSSTDFLKLLAVFGDADLPPDQANTSRRNVDLDDEESELDPKLWEPFSVGDGKGPGGQSLVLNVPEGAERLYLGFVDSTAAPGISAAGWFADNTGSVTAVVEVSRSSRN